MIDVFLLIGLPYLALVTALVAGVWRWRNRSYSLSARSSQFLEDRQLLWGSAPWHIGIITVLLGHIVAGAFPQIWSAILTVPGTVFIIETIGVAASLLAIVGLCALVVRRLTSARLQAVTTNADLIVVALLLVQILLGLITATDFRYGSVWSTGTVVPYFWSIVTLHPEMSYVADFPMLFKLHIVGGWLFVLVLPFTRLIHLLAVPVGYLWRAPQLVVWNNARRRQHAIVATIKAESRRAFLKGSAAVVGATGLMAIGVSEKLANFFKGPRHDPEAETELLKKKLERLQQTAQERQLELERQRSNYIFVARYTELIETKGKYFTDYAMAPGLAFRGKDGLPIVLSAKCTHLGCTVGSEVDGQGRVLCPCHISYFSIATGQPNEGAPAKLPLPQIGWALVDGSGNDIAFKKPGQPMQGKMDAEMFKKCGLYITKPVKGTA